MPAQTLTPQDLQALAQSWVTPSVAEQARVIRVSSQEASAFIGRNGGGNYAGLLFPYIWPGERNAITYRLRRDCPDMENGKTRNKYMAARGDRNRLYIVPGTEPAQLDDVSLPVVFTEGEKKTLALWRFAHEVGLDNTTRRPAFLPVGLSGVWNWRGVIGKETGPDGRRRDQKGPIPDLSRITWRADAPRTVYLLFDANAATNEDVIIARMSFAKHLRSVGARVCLIDLPVEDGVNGVDDYLGKHGPEPVLELFRGAREFIPKAGLAQFQTTDLGNDQAFETLYGNEFLFCHSRKKWLAWNEHAWQIDELGYHDRAMVEVAHARLQAVSTIQDEDVRKAQTKAALQLQNVAKRRAALESATTNPTFRRTINMFDQDRWLLATRNGVIDLRTGDFRPGRRSDMITMQCPVDYDPDAQCPRWLNFLDDIFEPHPEMVPFIRRAIGYSITGDTREECMFILHGGGRNGKGTMMTTLQHMMGAYAQTADFSTFTAEKEKKGDIRNDIARMKGARLVATSEMSEGIRLAEGTVKNLTGGDIITARFLHEENFDFLPTHKIWLAVNHLPTIRGTDKGIWSRIRLIPFEVSFAGREDKELKADLALEIPGILAWAVRGCLEWQRDGLGEPDAVRQATSEYRNDSDQIGRFLEERCLVLPLFRRGDKMLCDKNTRTQARTLYLAYKSWAEQAGEFVAKETAFANSMKERGRVKDKSHGVMLYHGISIIGARQDRSASDDDPGPTE